MYVKFTTTTSDKLSTLAVTNGQIIALADVDGYFYDMGGVRHSATGVKKVDILPATGQTGLIYIFNDKLYLWNGSQFVSANVAIATTLDPGIVKPDGTTITISSDGTISTRGLGVNSFNGRTGAVTLSSEDVVGALGYTPASNVGVNSFNTRTGAVVLLKDDVTNALGYTPPTTNTTYAAGSGLSLSGTTFSNTGVTSFKSRTGAVSPTSGDYTAALVTRTATTYVPGTTVEQSLVQINKINTFSVAATAWVANSDTTTSTDYPYVALINTTEYTAESSPVWRMIGAGTIPTKQEESEGAKVLQAYFTASNITLYATSKPSIALKLMVKGV